ncbi:RNA-directed DNA polymerase, eukaryota, reverse transcriptase zinc-binding domain protein [Tanacetum coccineum]|uniref:RNA-directed DNA polymerase, eukaryota, reverse transcriptase zinc-binding domain protein n=1 Tax=Tanacetum coccineum TaxID=301880 RepID=A0ABQ4X818_9ASTR
MAMGFRGKTQSTEVCQGTNVTDMKPEWRLLLAISSLERAERIQSSLEARVYKYNGSSSSFAHHMGSTSSEQVFQLGGICQGVLIGAFLLTSSIRGSLIGKQCPFLLVEDLPYLGSLGVYYFSTFKAPNKIINKLEGIRRKFFWGGTTDENKIAWIAWDKATSSISNGGLGIGTLKSSNLAMLSKWWWRFHTENHAFWCKIIRSIHGVDGGLNDTSLIKSKSGPWYRIAKLKDDLSKIGIDLQYSRKRLVTVVVLSFGYTWLGGSPLKDTFPRLFRLDSNPSCFVCNRYPTFQPLTYVSSAATHSALTSTPPVGLTFNWAWSRPIRSSLELCEFSELCSLVAYLRVSDNGDLWECVIDDSRAFSVKMMRSYINQKFPTLQVPPTRWNTLLPLKVNIFIWRTTNKRLLTRANLDYRGIDLDSVCCPMCDDAIETEDHIFVSCPIAKDTWKCIEHHYSQSS